MRSRDSIARVAIGPERQHPDREVGDARVAEAAQPVDDGRLVARREQVADVGRVAVLEQPLVVRRVLGVPERLVRPRPRRVDLVVAAQRDRHAGDDARRRPARPSAAAFVMRGTTCSPMARSSAIQRIVPRRVLARDAQHHRRERGERGSASATMSVTSSGLCTR